MESISKNECIVHSSNHEIPFSFKITDKKGHGKTVYRKTNILSWHYLIKYEMLELKSNPAVEAMEDWGFDICQSSILKMQEVFDSNYKKYLWNPKLIL